MEHNIPLITTIAAGFGFALIFGFIAERFKIPALVGYLAAGILIGPATPGFVADMSIASELAEIGVMLLMFGVGLHFSFKDLLAVKKIAVPGAVVQMSIATVLGMMLAMSWGWTWGQALVLGLSLSCASTVVLLKALEKRGALETMNGQIAVGWLVVEDLATVLILVILPPLAGVLGGSLLTEASAEGAGELWLTLGQTLLQIVAFVVLMLVVGRRLIPWLLWQVTKTGSRELFTLLIIAAAIGIAFGASALFHVSFALGAFFAGMVMKESEFSHRAAEESLPLRDAFSVLFFVSVGMLFEPTILFNEPLKVLAVVAIIVFGKSLAALMLVLVMKYPLNTALIISVSLAQIGEFSFILAGLGLTLGVLPAEGMSLVLAAALISIVLNPLLFAAISPLNNWLLARSELARRLSRRQAPMRHLPEAAVDEQKPAKVIIIGYGRVGKRIADHLDEQSIPYVVIEQRKQLVQLLVDANKPVIHGTASEAEALEQAGIHEANLLVVATPDPINLRQVVNTALLLNPSIQLVLRTHSEEECAFLKEEAGAAVFFGEAELAQGMSRYVVNRLKPV